LNIGARGFAAEEIQPASDWESSWCCAVDVMRGEACLLCLYPLMSADKSKNPGMEK